MATDPETGDTRTTAGANATPNAAPNAAPNATDDTGPRKMGVYEGAGTTGSQSKSILTILVVLVVALLVAVWLV